VTAVETKYNFLDVLRDTVTGYEGTVTAIVYAFGRSLQYGLQRKANEDGSVPDIYCVDEVQLEVVKASESERVVFANAEYGGGDVVRCRISGVEGKIVSVTEFLNGCIRYAIQRPVTKDGRVFELLPVYQNDLKCVKRAKVKGEKKETGGPSVKMAREKVL
jgi:hypothetical protein